jgi:hypothetical protein
MHIHAGERSDPATGTFPVALSTTCGLTDIGLAHAVMHHRRCRVARRGEKTIAHNTLAISGRIAPGDGREGRWS